MRKRITKRAINGLCPKQTPDGKRRPDFVWDTDVTGFGCKVTGAGKKVYIFQYRARGQSKRTAPKRITLGNHGELTPDQARGLAAKLLLQVKAGSDPVQAWQARDVPTMTALAERFLTKYLPGKKRPPRASTIADYERIFRRHVLPRLGRKRVEDITPDGIERLHTALRKTPYQANRMLVVLKQAFDQAERWGWRAQNTNPAQHIDRYPEERRGAKKAVMLSPDQMAALLEAIAEEERQGGDPVACAAIRFAFWTGWRIRSEVLRLEWANVNLEAGCAKLLRTKTASEEYRQLPVEAVGVLSTLPQIVGCRYVFPGNSATRNLTTVRKPWVRIRRRARLDKLDGLGALRLHDLRHNVVSWDVSRGVSLAIAGRNVGHRSRNATEVYAHFAPDALKQAADARAKAMRTAVEQVSDGQGAHE